MRPFVPLLACAALWHRPLIPSAQGYPMIVEVAEQSERVSCPYGLKQMNVTSYGSCCMILYLILCGDSVLGFDLGLGLC
jgi:hypothetical protein